MRAEEQAIANEVVGNAPFSSVKLLAAYMQMCMQSEHKASVVNQPPNGIQQTWPLLSQLDEQRSPKASFVQLPRGFTVPFRHRTTILCLVR
jgi:hypothetical protein